MLSEYDGEETFSRFDMIMPENYRTFGEWMRFANSLRLRLAVRIAMADPDKARDEAHKSLTHPPFGWRRLMRSSRFLPPEPATRIR